MVLELVRGPVSVVDRDPEPVSLHSSKYSGFCYFCAFLY
jgi:hypothetical protein